MSYELDAAALRLCVAFRASLDGNALDDLLISALQRAAISNSGGDILERSLAARDRYVQRTEARRADLERRNGAVARAAFDHYQRTRAAFAAGRDSGYDSGPSPLIAASMHLSQVPLQVF